MLGEYNGKNQISAGRRNRSRVTAYLLVSDSLDDEATAYIFKDVSAEESQEACYEMVEDEDELQAVFKVFEQMLDDDVDLEM